MSNDDTWLRHKRRIAAIAGLKPPAGDSFDSWKDAVAQLPADQALWPSEAACLCGVRTVAGLRYREKSFRPLPWTKKKVRDEVIIAKKARASAAMKARAEDMGETLSEPHGEPVTTMKTVRIVPKNLVDEWLVAFQHHTNKKQKAAAVVRVERKKQGRGPLTEEERFELALKKIAADYAGGNLGVVRDRAMAIIDREGKIVAFTPAQDISRDRVAQLMRDGGHMEMISLHEAVTRRIWLNPEDRTPWAELYTLVLNAAMVKAADRAG